MVCKWQVEIDDYATKVLEKHWPDVPKYRDVREFPPAEGVEHVDLICGGFPCQDISYAGKGAGINGERSGLWFEYARIIGDLRPRFVLVENVSALLVRGLDSVLGTLALLGYDAEWNCIPASGFGVPQPRERIFVMAYRDKSFAGDRIVQSGWAKLRAGSYSGASDSRGWQTWTVEPDVPRMAIGIPSRLDRVACLGNSVVPQVAQFIGECIMNSLEQP